MLLEGSCHCGAVRFSLESHTPYPYARCYCSICRKTAGSGGFGIFLLGLAERSFCNRCGSQLWLFDPRWPEHLHPFASAFDTPLPKPPAFLDYFLSSRAPWTVPHEGDAIERLDGPYSVGMEDWHRQRGLWVE